MNAAEVIVHLNRRFDATYELVGSYSRGESGAASKVIDAAANRYVLKIGAGTEFRPEHAATTELLRELGYPAPEYVEIGCVEETSFSLQRVLPGEPIGFPMHPALLPQLLNLNGLQRGHGESENNQPERLIRGVIEGYAEFCITDTLRAYSAESAMLLAKLQRIVADNVDDCPKRNDIVHFDFNPNNILIEGERISGVIDWEGSESGDCAFDLGTLLFYAWPLVDFRKALWRALLERTTGGAVAVYLAHTIVRQLDWSMRHHSRDTVVQFMRTAHEILHEIDHL